jgi:hypothetical protein
MESSSTSSPFSTRSTIPSSPEYAAGNGAGAGGNGDNTANNKFTTFPATSSHLMQGMQAILSNLTGK